MRALARWLVVAVVSLQLGVACRSQPAMAEPPADARRYDLKGTVVAVNPAVREIIVDHEEIPGFMDAMTMPFYVGEAEELRGLAPGDRITGELLVWDGGARLRALRKR
jgi:protein SCO1/2